MSVLSALIQADAQRRAGGTSGMEQITGVLQRQNIKRLSKEFLKQGDLTALGRYNFMLKNGLDENTMNAIQKVTDIVLTGGVDLGGTKIGNKMVSSKTGDIMASVPNDVPLSPGQIVTRETSPNVFETVAENPKTESAPTTIESALVQAKTDDERNQLLALQKKLTSMKEKKSMTTADLTAAALKGDAEAKQILDAMQERTVETSKLSTSAQAEAKLGSVDINGTARKIVEGKEIIDNVKNTFGLPVQEAVRKEVLKLDPDYNFNKPRATYAGVKSSLTNQTKQRGMMGSFVRNINKQLARVDEVMSDVIDRVGARAVDLPIRSLKRNFIGSGYENVLEAYTLEISNEIGKLSTGSSASIRELSVDAQERWAKIHDPNLTLNELKKVLDETRQMANMRLESTDEEIVSTLDLLDNLNPQEDTESDYDFEGVSDDDILKMLGE